MMLAKDILKFLGTKSKWLVLYVLFGSHEMSGREIARHTGLSWMPVRLALETLCEDGLLRCREKGQKKLYSLNEEHYLYHPIYLFFSALEDHPEKLLDQIRERFRSWGEPSVLSIGFKQGKKLLVITSNVVSSHPIVSRGLVNWLSTIGYPNVQVEILHLSALLDDESLLSVLDQEYTWIGGAPGRIKDIVGREDRDRRLLFFDF